MRLTIADVFNQLVAEGLAPPESIEKARAALAGAVDTSPPLLARIIAGFGAWIATAFLIGFLVITKIVDEKMSAIIVGAILVVAAVYLRRNADAEEEFRRQLAFAGSLAGQILVIVGTVGETNSAAVGGLVALVMSVALIPLVPDQAHRFMSGLIGTIAAFAAMADLHLAWTLGDVGPFGTLAVRGSDVAAIAIVGGAAYIWRIGIRERSREVAEMLEPVGYGIIVGMFAVLLFSSIFAVADDLVRGPRSTRVNAWHLGLLTTIAITVALIALELRIFAEQRVKPYVEAIVVSIAATVLLGLLTLSTPGIMAAITVLTLGFDRRNRVLIGLAIVFLVKFASVYYYSLRMTLLEKSMVLAASGMLLLAARAYVELRYKPSRADA
jgi:membrane-associated HD superfamily phosphohydrolase